MSTSFLGSRKLMSWVRNLEVLPTGLIVFILGVVLAFIRDPTIWSSLILGPSTPQVLTITWSDWKTGFVKGAIPQIPLSILNSVIAVCKLSNDLFPEKLVTPTAVSTSVGLMNMVGCWFGAMPACQWRFGAAVVFLGALKMVLGLVLGSSLARLLEAYPVGILGVLLFYAGLELAMACRDQTDMADSFVVISSAAMAMASNSAAIGFVFSLVIHILFHLPDVTRESAAERIRSIFRRNSDENHAATAV